MPLRESSFNIHTYIYIYIFIYIIYYIYIYIYIYIFICIYIFNLKKRFNSEKYMDVTSIKILKN